MASARTGSRPARRATVDRRRRADHDGAGRAAVAGAAARAREDALGLPHPGPSPRAGRDHRIGAGGPRHAGDHADRQRQVADLSAAGAGAGRADAGRLAAAGPHRGSVQQAQGGRRRGGAHRLDPHRQGARRRSGRRARGHDQAGDDHARVGELADRARGAGGREVLALLRRRGALRVAVGTRLPPGVPRPAPRRAGARAPADPRPDRHRHPRDRRRRPRPAGDEGRQGLPRLLPPPEPGVRRAQGGRRGRQAAPARQAHLPPAPPRASSIARRCARSTSSTWRSATGRSRSSATTAR